MVDLPDPLKMVTDFVDAVVKIGDEYFNNGYLIIASLVFIGIFIFILIQ